MTQQVFNKFDVCEDVQGIIYRMLWNEITTDIKGIEHEIDEDYHLINLKGKILGYAELEQVVSWQATPKKRIYSFMTEQELEGKETDPNLRRNKNKQGYFYTKSHLINEVERGLKFKANNKVNDASKVLFYDNFY